MVRGDLPKVKKTGHKHKAETSVDEFLEQRRKKGKNTEITKEHKQKPRQKPTGPPRKKKHKNMDRHANLGQSMEELEEAKETNRPKAKLAKIRLPNIFRWEDHLKEPLAAKVMNLANAIVSLIVCVLIAATLAKVLKEVCPTSVEQSSGFCKTQLAAYIFSYLGIFGVGLVSVTVFSLMLSKHENILKKTFLDELLILVGTITGVLIPAILVLAGEEIGRPAKSNATAETWQPV